MTFDIRTRTGAEEGQQLCSLRVTQQHLGLIDTDQTNEFVQESRRLLPYIHTHRGKYLQTLLTRKPLRES